VRRTGINLLGYQEFNRDRWRLTSFSPNINCKQTPSKNTGSLFVCLLGKDSNYIGVHLYIGTVNDLIGYLHGIPGAEGSVYVHISDAREDSFSIASSSTFSREAYTSARAKVGRPQDKIQSTLPDLRPVSRAD